VLIITYQTGEKIAQIIDAGAFQKKSNSSRNAMFEEIYKQFRISGIILTHDHFDHSGRLVSLHKAIRKHHHLPHLPIYTSHPSRQLLPHVLQSYHALQDNNT
jgi:glyoxylase-like metal-dependent hydrolase (beta-lactamase superfamily II)